MTTVLQSLLTTLEALPAFDPATIEPAVRGAAEANGLKAGAVILAVRVAMTGRTVSPGLFEVMSLLGRERVLTRLRDGIANG
jgi:glutamyl-tRNA synthetase